MRNGTQHNVVIMYQFMYVYTYYFLQDPELGSIDPQLERQIETIRNLVESYFGIVSKNIRDVVPKAIMHMMVNFLKEYLATDLLPMIYAAGNQDSLMEESSQAAQRREEMVRMYHTCKDALQLISEVSTRTGKVLEVDTQSVVTTLMVSDNTACAE